MVSGPDFVGRGWLLFGRLLLRILLMLVLLVQPNLQMAVQMVFFSGALMVRAPLAGAAHSAGACFAQACGGGHSAVRAGCGAGVTACGSGGSVPEASGT